MDSFGHTRAYHEEIAILIRCWVPEVRLREFLEAVVRATIRLPADPRHRPPLGAVWLDGDRLEDRCWDHIWGLLDRTGTVTRSWMGVCWECREGMGDRGDTADRHLFPWEQGMIACELQRDDGYDGVSVRLGVPPEVVELIRQTAIALGGGVGQAEPLAAPDRC
jgi:hypothetical protein